MRLTLGFVGVTLLLVGCDLSSSHQAGPAPVPKAAPLGAPVDGNVSTQTNPESKERLIGGIKWEFPVDWEEKSLSNTVILAEFNLPSAAGPGRLTLSTARGGMAANLERWKDQFRRSATDPEPVQSEASAAGKEATLLELRGTFNDSFGRGGPLANWGLLGVAIPVESDFTYFVKLTGPAETVAARREEFLKVIRSARFE